MRGLISLRKEDVLDKVYILIGVAPLKNLKIAQYLNTNIPGVRIPEKLMKRLEKAGASASEEGVQIALEVIDSVKGKKGVNGIHIMSLNWESVVPRIVLESGLFANTESS